ncbi:MAG: VanZ family protein [Bacillota bacterium]
MEGFKKRFSWLLVIIWMAVIFNFSAKPAVESNEMSTGITEKILEVVEKVVPSMKIDKAKFNHVIRKNAHFLVYFVLGILVLNGFKNSGLEKFKSLGLALLICVLYAISDEIHQVFVPGRGGQVKDVIIDSVGAIVGMGIYAKFWRVKECGDQQERVSGSIL